MIYQLTFFISQTNKASLTNIFDKIVDSGFVVLKKESITDSQAIYRRYYVIKTGSLMIISFSDEGITFVQLTTSVKSVMDNFRCDIMTVFDLIDPVIKEYGYGM